MLKVAPKLSNSEAKIVMLETYETKYGIYNHDLNDGMKPLALAAMHPAEDALTGGRFDERLTQFIDRNVYKYLGLSFKEFLEFPTDNVLKMLEVCYRKTTEDGQQAARVKQQLDQALGER